MQGKKNNCANDKFIKMINKINLILIIAIALLIMPIYSYFKFTESKTIFENSHIKKREDNALSLMYETKAGSGEYIISDDTSWPGDEYTFNETKSNCQNGSKLIWDEEAKTVSVKVNNSDKCYVYFDKKVTLANVCQGQNMASCIAAYYKLDNSIIYHDGTTRDATYGIIDAEDNSYRYSGPSEKVNNFVCFGTDEKVCPNDNLYRIIGVFENQVKLIKYDYALTNLLGTDGEFAGMYNSFTDCYKGPTDIGTIPGYYINSANGESSTSDWTLSKLNTINLNTNYINNIREKWADKIADITWKIGGISELHGLTSPNIAKIAYMYELGSNSINKAYPTKIGLMYLSDYYYAASPTYWTYYGYNSSDVTKSYWAAMDSNWMYMGLAEWFISSCTNFLMIQFFASIGYVNYTSVYDIGFGVRPSFYLKPSIVLSGGSGTMTDPYRIS